MASAVTRVTTAVWWRSGLLAFFITSILHGYGGVRRRRAADKQPPHALLKRARFGEGPKQHAAYLFVEARHLRGVGGGEPYAGCLRKQLPSTYEPFLKPPRHVR